MTFGPTPEEEAADLWRREQQEEARAEESQLKARHRVKYLRDVGDTKNAEAESKLNKIRKLADELSNLLENAACTHGENNT